MNLLRHRLLVRRVVEDGGAVLRPDIPALAVECRRVVDREEDVQQVVEGHDRGSKVIWTTSAWPVVPVQTSSYDGFAALPPA